VQYACVYCLTLPLPCRRQRKQRLLLLLRLALFLPSHHNLHRRFSLIVLRRASGSPRRRRRWFTAHYMMQLARACGDDWPRPRRRGARQCWKRRICECGRWRWRRCWWSWELRCRHIAAATGVCSAASTTISTDADGGSSPRRVPPGLFTEVWRGSCSL
jgi:hypothetical protein